MIKSSIGLTCKMFASFFVFSLIHLWNLSLHLYIEKLHQGVFGNSAKMTHCKSNEPCENSHYSRVLQI